MDNRPIGVFDSGLGGLTGVRELRRRLPHENIVYFGDTGRVPYGSRSPETILQYARQDIAFLLSKDVKCIMAACGTVSSTYPAAEAEKLPVPYLGVVDAAAREAMSRSICRRVSSLVREKNFRRVAVFAARPGEVDLLSLLDLLPDREWYFPLVHEGRRLSFHRVCHHGELVAGSWGIREPGPGCPELHAGEMDLIVLPGAAFTRDGKRLGYGGGFYDTLLAGPAAGVPLAGVCFPCQLLDDLPMEAHDRHVDMVIAPEGE